MQSMNISLPEPLKQFVDGQVAEGRYSSASEYVRELIRTDEKEKALARMEAKLLAGLEGEALDVTPEYWEALAKRARAALAAKRAKLTPAN